MGVLHADQKSRDSFALDLIERRSFAAAEPFETRQGHCRLMPALTVPLTDVLP